MVRELLILRTALCSVVVVLALLLTGPLTPATAQILYGSVVGNVTDESGASVPGAEMTITNKQTGATRTTTTNESGGFSIPTVQNGDYTIRVAREGFRVASNENVAVAVNSVVRADFRLTLG